MMFIDRRDAGRRLAERLEDLRGRDVVILGLPRGGVSVAFEVARALGLPLDVIVVRKLGMPSQPELAMGAIGEGGVRILNQELRQWGDVAGGEIAAVERREQAELESRVTRLRAGRSRIPLKGRTAVIVDDGVATGSTARAACQVARAQGASQVVLAVPVAAAEAAEALRGTADEVVCLQTPDFFYAVGQWYEDFSQVPDEEVVGLLKRAAQELGRAPGQDPGPLNSVPTGR
jgi:putative phosphoribosyl transferase